MVDPRAEHPTQEQLIAFGGQALDDADWASVEEPVAGCDRCRQILETLPEDPLAAMVRGATVAMRSNDAPPCLHAGYEILELIGQGGMGVVFKARQAGLGRLVALKWLHAGRWPKPESMSRFRREAEAIARLDHASIVRIYEVGEQDGQPYLALEYVAGPTLKKFLAGNPLAPAAAAALVATLATAIDHAHQHGIVHRDLKPANVLLQMADCRSQNGNTSVHQPEAPAINLVGASGSSGKSEILNLQSAIPKITDFGLAKLVDQEQVQTQTGDILGTPGYMAPEQATGQAHAVGARTSFRLKTENDLKPLHQRPEYQKLLTSLQNSSP